MSEVQDRAKLDQDGSAYCSATRREFLKGVSGAAVAATGLPLVGKSTLAAGPAKAGPTPSALAETAVARLYKTITPEQKKLICFPFDNPLRSKVGNNWAIVKPMISDMSAEQQSLCREIMKNLCSEEGYERFMKQMDDDSGGFETYHVALFGEPGGEKPFEWVLSGRHDTLRADGNSVEGAAFGGPIFYGHAADGNDSEDAKHTNNVWWYQGEQANKIFRTLDEKQKAQGLVAKAPADSPVTIKLKGDHLTDSGLSVATLDGQQKAMVKELVSKMLSPFRAADVQEVWECLAENGGIDRLRITYVKEGDIGNDEVWDNLKLEGPTFAWYFRGSPHVHTWLNVARHA